MHDDLPPSLPAFLRSRARAVAPKPALIVAAPGGDLLWTFADLWTEIRNQARWLLDQGVQPRIPVLMVAAPAPEPLLTELALQAIQSFAIRMTPDLPLERLVDGARQADVQRLMHHHLESSLLEALQRELPDLPFLAVPTPAPPLERSGLDGPDDPRLDALVVSGPDAAGVAVLPEGASDLLLARMLVQRNFTQLGSTIGRYLGGIEEDLWWVPLPGQGAFPYCGGLAPAWLSNGMVALDTRRTDPLESLWRLHPSVVVLSGEGAERLTTRLEQEVSQAGGWNGLLARWALRRAMHSRSDGPLSEMLDALVERAGLPTLRALVGGRLDRVLVSAELSPRAQRVLEAFRVRAFLARGPLSAAEIWTLDALPLLETGGTLVPGTEVRSDAEGRLEVRGASATRRLHLRNWNHPEQVDGWAPTLCPGRVLDQRILWGSISSSRAGRSAEDL